jgi:hypothetical protein
MKMISISWMRAALLPLLAAAGLAMSGCGGGGTKAPEADKQAAPAADSSCSVAANWCIEHGVPEDICGQCNAKVAADCQRKGDWCRAHNRPESQCFVCHPELQARFIAQYEAKYGKKPPQPDGK